ncbi:MAG: hypothetical protein Q9214_004088 [Letrouitia sp. 1 TL-2023]
MNHLDLSGGDRVPPSPWDIKSLIDGYRGISRYGASIKTDKVAIRLNVVGSDLFYHGGARTAGECEFLLTLIALTAGDPAVLCCSGKEYLISSKDVRRSWLRQPQIGDINGTLGRRWAYRRLDYVPDFTPEQLSEQNPDEYMLITDTIEALSFEFLTASDPIWVPLWVDFGHNPLERVMILGPKNRKFTVVIPTLLLHKEYTDCRRVFIVDQGPKEDEIYDTIGKSTTFEGVDINLDNTASLQNSG